MKTKAELLEAIKDKKVIVDFWAPWCGPCKMLIKTLEEFDKKETGVEVLKINVDENGELATEFGIRSIPALYLFDKGEEVKNHVGSFNVTELEDWVK